MGVTLSIKNVPEEWVDGLRERARRHHRSMQGELMAILEAALAPRRLSVREAWGRLADLDLRTGPEAVWMVREDRDGR